MAHNQHGHAARNLTVECVLRPNKVPAYNGYVVAARDKAESVTEHWAALRRTPPDIVYREIFPNATSFNRALPREGWSYHCGLTATHMTMATIEKAATAFDEDLAPVASFPTDVGVTNGYLNNWSVPTVTNALYWTEEMTNQVECAWLSAVAFDAKFNTAQPVHVALRLDVSNTPQDTDDDIWYAAQDFANPAGTSALAIPVRSDWWRYLLDLTTAEWTTLTFKPGVALELGETQSDPPEQALITGFGLFHPKHYETKNERLDNFTLYMRQIYPPRGTLIQVH